MCVACSGRFAQVRTADIKTRYSPPPFFPHIVPVIKSLRGFRFDLFTPAEKICSLSSPEINDGGEAEKRERANRERQTEKESNIERKRLFHIKS